MGKLKIVEELFKGRHFDRGIVILCVRWYLRFKLSLRDLVEMMAERGLRWRIRRSCAGSSGMLRSSRNAGDGLPGQSASPVPRHNAHLSTSLEDKGLLIWICW